MSSRSVLVIRATGTQGRAVCSNSLQQGFKVHALVRDSKEDRALDLQEKGVALFQGSIDDRVVLDTALNGCEYLFINLMPRFDEEASELRQAKIIIDAAKAAGVKHVVSSSMIARESSDDVVENPMYKASLCAKRSVEEFVQNSGFDTWTVLRPGYFMTNFFYPLGSFMYPELVSEQRFVTSLQPDTVLPLIDPNDIGAFAAAAFLNPKKFDKQALTIASEMQTVEEVLKLLSQAIVKKIEAVYRGEEESRELAKMSPIIAGQLVTRLIAKEVDMASVNTWGIKLSTFSNFLRREEELVRRTFNKDNTTMDFHQILNKPS